LLGRLEQFRLEEKIIDQNNGIGHGYLAK